MNLQTIVFAALISISGLLSTCEAETISCFNKYPVPRSVRVKILRLIPFNENRRTAAYRIETSKAFWGTILGWRSTAEVPTKDFEFFCKSGACDALREGQEVTARVRNGFCDCCSLTEFLSLPPQEQYFNLNKVITKEEYDHDPVMTNPPKRDWWYSDKSSANAQGVNKSTKKD